ncbi:thioredoxin family protein [Microbulbifer celer]|uniref:Thioredoxin family protein n=1 Tax=Microbulbifer celer TaxID=435905 RepID=A0ABW3U901_9GAMM|nr:thioredoxin domain-containing protein [Microbulbifer celer]UFN56424.1 thioredoxin domain-containing protein [Microbulbifer celer]
MSRLSRVFILMLLSLSLPVFSAELQVYELQVNPELKGEFERSLPEFLAYSPDGKCLLHTRGFSSAESYMNKLDRALAGKEMAINPARVTVMEKARERSLRESIQKDDRIPQDQKEVVLQSMLAKINSREPACTDPMEFYQKLLQHPGGRQFSLGELPEGKAVFIEYYADWCAPCKKQEKVIRQYALERGDEFVLLKVERDKVKLYGLPAP